MATPAQFNFPKLYPILDVDCLRRIGPAEDPARLLSAVADFARQLAAGGASMFQYRAKQETSRTILAHARELRRVLGPDVTLIMNDRVDLCLSAGFDGVHVGQDDLAPDSVRKVGGDRLIVGVSTHNVKQFEEAAQSSATYLAIGPIFSTFSKQNPDPVVGLDGLRQIRAWLRERNDPRPLVAIGGITRANARSVIDAGADSVAVIADLVNDPRASVEEFLRILV